MHAQSRLTPEPLGRPATLTRVGRVQGRHPPRNDNNGTSVLLQQQQPCSIAAVRPSLAAARGPRTVERAGGHVSLTSRLPRESRQYLPAGGHGVPSLGAFAGQRKNARITESPGPDDL